MPRSEVRKTNRMFRVEGGSAGLCFSGGSGFCLHVRAGLLRGRTMVITMNARRTSSSVSALRRQPESFEALPKQEMLWLGVYEHSVRLNQTIYRAHNYILRP